MRYLAKNMTIRKFPPTMWWCSLYAFQKLWLLKFILLLGVGVIASAGCSFSGTGALEKTASPRVEEFGTRSTAPIAVPQGSPSIDTPPVAKPVVTVQRCTIDVYGDSIMANNSTSERPLIALQRRFPGLVFIDHSAPEVLLTVLGRGFNSSPRSGRWVVIENGVIDAWKKTQPAVFVQTLVSMIERVRSEGREPVLTGFSRQVQTPVFHIHKEQLARRDQYDLLVRRTAESMKVPFVDWGAVRFDGASDLQDGIHPGLAYSNRLFEKLGSKLVELSGCK